MLDMSTWEETSKEQMYYSIHEGRQSLSVISYIFEHLVQIHGKVQPVRKSTTEYCMHAFLMRENILQLLLK